MTERLNQKSNTVIADKTAKCVRCKQACMVVEDCYEHEFGRTPFLESDCCGAPVVWVPLKKN